MSTPDARPEPILLHNVQDRTPRLRKNREERAWYKRWPWFPTSTWTTSASPVDLDRKTTIPAEISRNHSPNLAKQSSENIIPNHNAIPTQFSDWTARHSAADANRCDGKPTAPQHSSNSIIEKERELSGYLSSCASPHEMASGLHEPANRDEVKSPDIQYIHPIPSVINDQHLSNLNSDSPGSANEPDGDSTTTEHQYHSNPQRQVTVDREMHLRTSRPNSLSSGTSDSDSGSYKYTADKSHLDRDILNIEYLGIPVNYPYTSTYDPTGTSPEHDTNRCSSSENPPSELIPETALFFSPKSSVLSESSRGPTITPKSSSSSISIYSKPRPLRQLQAGGTLQEGSILNSAINTLVDEATLHFDSDDSSLPDIFATDTSSNPPSSRSAEELENRFVTLINIQNALLLRQLAVATDIGTVLELLMPKMRLYVKDEATLTKIYEEISSIKQECLDRRLDIHLHALEFLSSTISARNPSMQKKIEALQRELQPLLDKYQASRDAALRFIVDPRALLENRLGIFSMSQR